MNFWSRQYFRRGWAAAAAFPKVKPAERAYLPLPVLVHAHPQGTVPHGALELGIVAWEQDGVVLHALEGVVQPDGSIADVPPDRLEWARRLSYRHLRREGCLATFGIPVHPAYEYLELHERCHESPMLE